MTDDETRVMSEALTRGATMLDDACDDCGNPLFRYQGDVFCAVCREVSEDNGGGEEKTEAADVDDTNAEETRSGAAKKSDGADYEVEENLRVLARRLARDAAESADDPDAVERRLDALERTLELLGRA
ncbi:MAG: Sjogren's syndrome/scleroderma autoantigen 1 family protein [Halobacteriales archaeon]